MKIVMVHAPGMLNGRVPNGAEVIETPYTDPFKHWAILRSLYESQDDFLLIEQDISMTDNQIAEIRDCPEEWCVYGFKGRGAAGNIVTTSCIRLRGSIARRYPFLLRRDVPSRVPWYSSDGTIFGLLKMVGLQYHRHYPDVQHDPQPYPEGWGVTDGSLERKLFRE